MNDKLENILFQKQNFQKLKSGQSKNDFLLQHSILKNTEHNRKPSNDVEEYEYVLPQKSNEPNLYARSCEDLLPRTG